MINDDLSKKKKNLHILGKSILGLSFYPQSSHDFHVSDVATVR